MRLFAFALATMLATGASQAPEGPDATRAAPKGVEWFRGTFDQALARARGEGRPLFVVLRHGECKPCDELERGTLARAPVVAELADSICLMLDGASGAGAALVARFGVREFPTLIWLSSDGSLRDRAVGSLATGELLRLVRRIRADRETIGELRRRVAADEGDVDLRWRLAQRLRAAGDGDGAELQIRRIQELDPDGRSRPRRLMRLDEVRPQVRRTYDESRGEFDTRALTSLLEREDDPEVLFRGWSIVAEFEAGALARIQQARHATAAQAAAARGRRRAALRRAWPHCPFDELARFGNELAWAFYEAHPELGEDDRRFALDVATRAAAAAGDDPSVLDTLACCLAVNDRRDEALALVRRCIELEPTNEQWRLRLEELAP